MKLYIFQKFTGCVKILKMLFCTLSINVKCLLYPFTHSYFKELLSSPLNRSTDCNGYEIVEKYLGIFFRFIYLFGGCPMVIWRSEVNLCQVPSILSFLPPSSSPPSLPLSSPVSLPTLFAITLFLNPYIFQAYREDTSLFVVITFHESFTLMVAVSLDCECVADICSGIRAFRTAGKP